MIQNSNIVIASNQHISDIVNFQIKSALIIENISLDSKLVFKVIKYVIDASLQNLSKAGFYLIKTIKSDVISMLCLQPQSTSRWWMYSVFTKAQYRNQGHFKTLFQKSFQILRQNGGKQLYLYVQKNNQSALTVYTKLGMNLLKSIFYSYSFDSGRSTPSLNNNYNFQVYLQHEASILEWGKDKTNLLNDKLQQSQEWWNTVTILKQNKLIGAIKYFNQQDWNNTIIISISSLIFIENTNMDQLMPQIIHFFVQISTSSIGSIRFLINQDKVTIFNGGNILPYVVFRMNID